MKSKVSLSLITALILAILFLYFSNRNSLENITNYPPKGNTIVAFGDSLVEGIGSTRGNDFVSVLSRNIGLPIVNLGIAGNTTTQGLERLDNLLKENPDIVILLLGGNDYLQKLPREETIQNLENLILEIQKSGAVTVLLGVRGGVLRDNFKDDFEDLAKTHGTAYVPDVLDGLLGKSEFMYDTIHPNDKGYQKIAERLTPIIKELLVR